MIVAADLRRWAHAVERLVRQLPISPRNADDIRAALRLAYAARELLTETDGLHHWGSRRVHVLRSRHARLTPRPHLSEPRSHLRPIPR